MLSIQHNAILLATVLLSGAVAAGQRVPPFFSPGVTAFEPEIGIVNTGVVEDAQVVVSADRKYVTINMQAADTKLLALKEFTFQQGPQLGFVGMPAPLAPAPAAANRMPKSDTWQPVSSSANQIRRQADSWVLDRQGMFRIASAD